MSKYPLIQSENGEYYSGHYCKSKEMRISVEESLKKVKFDTCLELLPEDGSFPCPYENAYDFLQGACNLFIVPLFQMYEYDVFEIIDENGETIHWYASTQHQGIRLYIDVRGATSDFEKFIFPFSQKIKMEYSVIQRQGEDLLFKEDWSDTGELFAYSIIGTYEEYYKID